MALRTEANKKVTSRSARDSDQRGYGYEPGEFDMAKSCLQVAPSRPANSKQAARDVDHVPVLDIFWVDRLAANSWPKVNGLGALYSVDYASQMNIAGAAIVTYST